MARLQGNTRIYGTANVDTSIGVGGNVVVNASTLFIGNSTVNTYITATGGLFVNNNVNINFRTVNASASVSMRQQSDDNFVFYSTNTAYGARAIWSVFANSITSNLSISVPTNFGANAILTTLLIANGGSGTAGQVLTSNGSTGSPYWAAVSAGGALLRAPQILTSGTSYTTPANCTKIYVEAVGGGGGSGGSPGSPYGGCGGGGGGGVAKYFTVTASTAYTYAIGAAGSAGSSSAGGGNGGDTTFTVSGTTITASGGAGGQLGGSSSAFASGGGATNGDLNITGGSSGRAGGPPAYLNELGSQGGHPGLAYFGTGGPASFTTGAGISGSGYGAGASGGTNGNQAGAAGTQGVIRIWEFA
jgi:hypothetical protein